MESSNKLREPQGADLSSECWNGGCLGRGWFRIHTGNRENHGNHEMRFLKATPYQNHPLALLQFVKAVAASGFAWGKILGRSREELARNALNQRVIARTGTCNPAPTMPGASSAPSVRAFGSKTHAVGDISELQTHPNLHSYM